MVNLLHVAVWNPLILTDMDNPNYSLLLEFSCGVMLCFFFKMDISVRTNGRKQENTTGRWNEVNCTRKWSEVTQSCPTLCFPVNCSLPGSSIHGILQARILEWVAISFSRVSSRPRDRNRISCIGGRRFNLWATKEAPSYKLKSSAC